MLFGQLLANQTYFLTSPGTYQNTSQLCLKNSSQPAVVNATNFLQAVQFLNTTGVERAFIESWNGDNYGEKCIALYKGGAITVPEKGCNETFPTLCEASKNVTSPQPQKPPTQGCPSVTIVPGPTKTEYVCPTPVPTANPSQSVAPSPSPSSKASTTSPVPSPSTSTTVSPSSTPVPSPSTSTTTSAPQPTQTPSMQPTLSPKSPYAKGKEYCNTKGMEAARITSENIIKYTQNQTVFIESWNGDDYGDACIALFPGGAIDVPESGCNAQLPTLCVLKKGIKTKTKWFGRF